VFESKRLPLIHTLDRVTSAGNAQLIKQPCGWLRRTRFIPLDVFSLLGECQAENDPQPPPRPRWSIREEQLRKYISAYKT
jgi:hypothetical protein